MLGQELVDDFAEKLMSDKGRVLLIGDDDATDAFGAGIGVESLICGGVDEYGSACAG